MCKENDSINRNFFWNKARDGEGIVNMFELLLGIRCRLKSEGCLGIKNTEDTNAAFLAKHG